MTCAEVVAESGACWWCGCDTHRLDFCFEAWLCADCAEAADRAYWWAVAPFKVAWAVGA